MGDVLKLTCSLCLVVGLAWPAAAAEPEAARLQAVLDDLDVMVSMLDGGRINEATRRELLRKAVLVRDEVASVQEDLLRASASISVEGPGGLSLSVDIDDGSAPAAAVAVGEPMPLEDAPPMPPLAMAAEPFAALTAAVESESFGDEKVAVLRAAAADNLFVVEQVRRLLPLFTFSDERVEAAVILYPRTIDQENWFQVYQEFDFDSDKEELRKRLGL